MDGNGRWAAARGLPRIEGHRRGSEAARQCTEACIEAGIPYLTLYAFSSENWKRPKQEVSALMMLLEQFLDQRIDEMHRNGIRLRAIGRLYELPASCQRKLEQAMRTTENNTRLTLILALSYGGREEITDAVRSLVADARAGRLHEDQVDAALISSRLYTRDWPDPDLLIRTSGEMRLSNFLLWQLSYTELHVTPKLWPDFTKEDLHSAIEDYVRRHRRFGGVS